MFILCFSLQIWDGCFSLRYSVKAHALSIITCSPCHAEGTVLTCAKRDDTAMVFSSDTFTISIQIGIEQAEKTNTRLIKT